MERMYKNLIVVGTHVVPTFLSIMCSLPDLASPKCWRWATTHVLLADKTVPETISLSGAIHTFHYSSRSKWI